MKTRRNKKRGTKKKRSRARKLPGLYGGNDCRDEKFLNFLDSGDRGLMVYIYRAKNDWPVGRYIHQCFPFRDLEEFIRDEFGGGEYAIMIRRDGTMLFSAILAIGVPLNWQPKR